MQRSSFFAVIFCLSFSIQVQGSTQVSHAKVLENFTQIQKSFKNNEDLRSLVLSFSPEAEQSDIEKLFKDRSFVSAEIYKNRLT